jgi:gliding motility-associated-like protein
MRITRKKVSTSLLLLLCFLLPATRLMAQSTTFPSGSAIIDMGSTSPTTGNSLKPYGLVYSLLKNKNVPVSVVIGSTKSKDGIDFTYGNKSYKGGTFIVSSDYITSDVTTLLNAWSNQGVNIDYTTGDLTVNVTYKINFVPKWVLDKTNGGIAVSYLSAAGIPSSAYSFKDPSQLGDCDDIFVLPHADPSWNTHNNLFFWNRDKKGAIWAGCHAVSVLENLTKDTTIGGVATTLKMNFLSTNGLLTFTDHNYATAPFSTFLPADPVGQYYNKTDNAQQNGSETVYLPKSGGGWNSGVKILTTSPGQADVPSLSPGAAVINAYGRAFNDNTRGLVGYQASHNFNTGSAADQIAAQRIFLNFSLYALNDKVPPIISASLSGNGTTMTAGSATTLTASVTGTATGLTYQWTASVSGTFSNANAATTTFTPSSSISSSTNCIITCTVTESCGRVSFDRKKLVVKPPSTYTLVNRDTTINVAATCTSPSVKFNVFTNNPDDNAGARTLVSVTGLGNGTVSTTTGGDVTFTANANFKGKTTGTYTITNGVSTSSASTITIYIGDSTLAPVLVTKSVTTMVDNVTQFDVLSTAKNTSYSTAGDSLYIRDITSKPTKGYALINTNGTLSYLSTKDPSSVSGGDTFQYLACNTKTGYCTAGTVNITLIQDACAAGQYSLTNTGTATTAMFSPTADAYFSVNSSTGWGSSSNLTLYGGGGTSTNIHYSLLKFGLTPISTSSTVNSATLSLTASVTSTFSVTAQNSFNPATAYSLLRDWNESQVTGQVYSTGNAWASTSLTSGTDYSSSNSGTFTVANGTLSSGTVITSTDITSMVQSWVTTPTNNYGVVIIPTTTTTAVGVTPKFHSRESGTTASVPWIKINYTPPATCSTIPTTYKPIAYPDTSSTKSNTAVTIDVLANDKNYYSNTNSITAVTTPAHGTASISSGKIVYTPSGSFVGTDTLTYTITDGTYSTTNTATVRINVSKVAPVINRDSTSTNSGTAVTINVGSNDSDPQGSIGAPTVSTNPKNGTASISGNNIVYTPAAKFIGNDTLIYSRSGTAADDCSSALSDTALVVITVLNQAPTAKNDTVTTYACTPINIKIKNNDTDPEGGDLTVTIVTNPSNGTIAAQTDGSYTYTPNTGYTGSDSFTYTVKDPKNAVSNTATVVITVSSAANPNTAPLAVDDNDNTKANQPVYTNVLSNDSDAENDALSISITAGGLKAPSSGTIQLMANKTIKYTPNAGFTGTDTYQYLISDTHPSCTGNSSLSAKATVTITVTANPVLVSGTIWNDADFSANETFTNIKTNSETGTNANGAIYVYLTDSTNKIIDLTPADDVGVYQLSSVPSNTSKLSLILSKEVLSVGGSLSTPSLPTGWVNTSPAVRTFTTSSSDITGYDFGVANPSVTGGAITSTTSGFCLSGTPGALTSSTDATNYTSIQWQLSTTSGGSGFTNISGATGMSYTPTGAINTTTWYRRKATASGGSYAYSNVFKVAVNPTPVISISPTALSFSSGISNTVTASGASTYTWSPATNLSATTGATVTFKGASNGSTVYTVTGTDDIGCVGTKTITISVVTTPVASAISGPCAVGKNTTKTYTVSATNATSYVWTLPNGWTGTSTSASISATAGTAGGIITVTPYNGSLAGNTVSFSVSVIDYTKVTLGGLPVTASGNNNSQIKITVTLYDVNGNRINCSGGNAAVNFCTTNPGSFTPVVDNNDGTYTTFVTASANTLDICGSVDSIPVTNKTTVTFTGPQGSISAIPPILASETPKVKFTMTAGRAPFTVIYKSAKSNKTDTVTNYTSGVFVNSALIPSTTLYTLVSIIDANGERRDNNFTRDTVSIVVLVPKVIITLKAETPRREPDSTWATVINVKTKNIGDLPLFNSGALLDLKSVFPSPVTFRLDSVKWSGASTVVPNRNYDGVQNTDLFAALYKPMKRMDLFIPKPKQSLANDWEAVTASPDGTLSAAVTDFADEPQAVLGEDGHSVSFFGSQSSLDLNAEAFITLYLHIKPNGYTDPFIMQAIAVGTGKTDGATALTTSISNDNEDVSKHPEVTKQGDPIPTVVNLFPTASIGTALNAGTPVLQGNGTYNVLMTYKLRNYGNVNLTNVQITNNLLTSIGAPAVFTVTGPITATGALVPNQSFNGKTNINLIASGFELGYKQEAVITYTLNIAPNQLSALYNLQTTASGFSIDLNQTVTDLSTDGTNPDPDGNNIPSEKIITQILINRTIPVVVPGPVAFKTATGTSLTQTICAGTGNLLVIPTGLNSGGSLAYQYQWQVSTDNTNFTDILGAEDSTYTTGTFEVTSYLRRGTISGNQIKYSNVVTVFVNPRPAKPVITGGGFVVGRGPAVLTAPAATAYLWSTGSILQTTGVTTAGSYTVTVTDANGCVNTSDAFVVTLLDPYKVADIEKVLSKPVTLQADGSFTLGFTLRTKNLRTEALDSLKIKDDLTKVFPSGVQFQVTDIKASGQLIANSQYNGNTQIDMLGDVSKLAGSKTDSVEVMLKVTPLGFAGTLSNSATLTAKSPFGNFTITSNDPTVGNGISVRNPTKFVIPIVDIFIPSGFSPNRDGVNDVFVITRPVTTTISLEIYNRWGNSVYKSPDYKNEWDGRGNQPNRVLGDELPDGTYYYIVLATDKTTGSVRKFAGYVTLKR